MHRYFIVPIFTFYISIALHVVIINQYFPPDAAPTGLMLKSVAEAMLDEGHEVTVICASEGYAPGKGRSGIRDKVETDQENHESGLSMHCKRVKTTTFGRGRLIGKLADYASFYFGVAWILMTMPKRPERIIAMTTPPYLSILARFFSKLKGGDHAHWVMDLYPDAMVAHGILSEGSIWQRFLEFLSRWGYGGSRCQCVLSLGPDMADRLGEHLMPGTERPWVPLWSSVKFEDVDNNDVELLRAKRGWGADDLVLMYSGNMGLGHLFDEVLEVATSQVGEGGSAANARTRFVFYGMGKRRVEIERAIELHPESSIELHGYMDTSELQTHLLSADVHLVSLRSSWNGIMVPSKLQGIFEAGKPVIFIGSEKSSIGRWVHESGGGWVVRPNDVAAFKKAIDESRIEEQRQKRGKAARAFAQARFDREKNACRCAVELCRSGE